MWQGYDLDELLAYKTPKVVVIKDYKLGLIRVALLICVFLYIFVYLILYQGKHLLVSDVNGVFRLSLQHPTAASCDVKMLDCMSNYSSLAHLPYCDESPIPYAAAKKPCQIWDYVESSFPVDQGILIPTHITRFDQRRGCEPSKANDFTCDGVPYEYLDSKGAPQKPAPTEPEPVYDAYVADIEHFTLEVDHQFRLYGGMQADDYEMQGYWLQCASSKSLASECTSLEIPCSRELGSTCLQDATTVGEGHFLAARHGKHSHVRMSNKHVSFDALSKHEAETSERLPGQEPVVAAKRGDVFEVATLLKATNDSFDDIKGEGSPNRATGMVLVLHISYENRPQSWVGLKVLPWHTPHPWYTYQISTRAAFQYKITKTFDDPAKPTRTSRDFYGMRVVVEQGGKIVRFEIAQLVITLTAALGMMAIATTVTELVMSYVMKRKEVYKAIKFQKTRDFHSDSHKASLFRDDDHVPLADGKPTTKDEAAELLLAAIHEQDKEAIAIALPSLMSFCEMSRT